MKAIGTTPAREQLRSDGYCRFHVGDFGSDLDLDAVQQRLRDAIDDLPPDSYALSRNRYRRYSPGVLIPWLGQFEWAPNLGDAARPYTEYFQADHNPEFPDVFRRFPPLGEDLKSDPVLHRIISGDFGLTFWSERQLARPFVVGVHLVKLMVSRAGTTAYSSPNHLHQDGEPFTFVHLIARDNAVGATNVIAQPHCQGSMPEDVDRDAILAEFELEQPLESYGVCDRMISHHVSSLERGPAARPGLRAAMLIDFTPLIAAL